VKPTKIGKKPRKRIRKLLWKTFGSDCCWCGEPMIYPNYGEPMDDIGLMATIEHHFSKEMGSPDAIMHLRLSHKKCNK
jgi:hypothetical protein